MVSKLYVLQIDIKIIVYRLCVKCALKIKPPRTVTLKMPAIASGINASIHRVTFASAHRGEREVGREVGGKNQNDHRNGH